MGLYEKMYKVMCESKALEKKMEVAGQYKAVSEQAMLNEVKPLLKNNKLIIFPVKSEVTQLPNGNKSITQVNVTYKIVDVETGENELLTGIGNGADSQDKGAGKAFTYAYKAMLSKTFMLFSGEDTDNDHSDDITKSQLNDLRKELKDYITSNGKEVSAVEKHYKMKVDDMNEAQLKTVIKAVEKSLQKVES